MVTLFLHINNFEVAGVFDGVLRLIMFCRSLFREFRSSVLPSATIGGIVDFFYTCFEVSVFLALLFLAV